MVHKHQLTLSRSPCPYNQNDNIYLKSQVLATVSVAYDYGDGIGREISQVRSNMRREDQREFGDAEDHPVCDVRRYDLLNSFNNFSLLNVES